MSKHYKPASALTVATHLVDAIVTRNNMNTVSINGRVKVMMTTACCSCERKWQFYTFPDCTVVKETPKDIKNDNSGHGLQTHADEQHTEST